MTEVVIAVHSTLLDRIIAGEEKPISLNAARSRPELERDGRRPDLATMHRWASKGTRGVILESCIHCSSRVTTAEALIRFLRRLNGMDVCAEPTAARAREVAAAAERNRRRGL